MGGLYSVFNIAANHGFSKVTMRRVPSWYKYYEIIDSIEEILNTALSRSCLRLAFPRVWKTYSVRRQGYRSLAL